MKIQVLGSGCPTCKKFFETVKQVAQSMGLKNEVEYVDDVTKIIEMGVMTSPALLVDNKIVLTGGGHNEAVIKNVLEKSAPDDKKPSTCCCCCG